MRPHVPLGRPSPALVISIVALVLAAAGTGYAAATLPRNSVGTAQLKNKAVTAAKTKGDLPSAGVAGLTIAKDVGIVAPRNAIAITFRCPSGLVAIGGGLEAPHTLNTFLVDSHPTAARGWELGVANGGDVPESVTASVICVKPAPGTPKAGRATARIASRPLR